LPKRVGSVRVEEPAAIDLRLKMLDVDARAPRDGG
jgi:hypothetical protein